MKWKKLGRFSIPYKNYRWMSSYASVPVSLHIRDNLYRFYFSTRNKLNQNQVGYIECDITNPLKILKISDKPVISIGKLGYFDCDGVYGTSIVKKNSKLYFYYAGWNAGTKGLFFSSIGLAISEDYGLTFKKVSEAPIMSRDEVDKWAVMAPFVMIDGDCWKMWYVSGIKLLYENDALNSRYDVKYAYSKNGINWKKTGKISLSLGGKDTNIARACVIKEKGKYKCWYPYVSRRIGEYRIGYGESKEGEVFFRKDQLAGIDVSSQGWDSKAITYPYVFRHQKNMFMLYNGNNFGKSGFGIAVLEGG